MNINLDRSEVEMLISRHTELQYDYAGKEEYTDAAYHKERAEELRNILKAPTTHGSPWSPSPPQEDDDLFDNGLSTAEMIGGES